MLFITNKKFENKNSKQVVLLFTKNSIFIYLKQKINKN